MPDLTRILSYGEFWDVPRLFVVTVDDGLLRFDSEGCLSFESVYRPARG